MKNEIRREFLGEDYAQHRLTEKRKKKQKYLTMLYNLQICDINYFDAYVCEFEKYYYKSEVSASTQPSLNFHNDMFFTNYHTHGVILYFQNGKKLTVQNEQTR